MGSTPGGAEVGTTSSQIDKEGKWYQSLFSAPRSRRDSAETSFTRSSEVWDTIRREKINFRGHNQPTVVLTRPHTDLPDDFQGRLQAYLDEEDEKKKWRKQKKGRKFKTKKRRRKRKKDKSD